VAIGLGTAAFSMQDVLLEPYGGQILRLTVAETTALTALLAAGDAGRLRARGAPARARRRPVPSRRARRPGRGSLRSRP
jgi:hypothetical protein